MVASRRFLLELISKIAEIDSRPPHSGSTDQRTEDKVSVTASDSDFLASDADDSLEHPASVGGTKDVSDKEMSAMLAWAATSLGMQCTHCLPHGAHG